VLCSNEKNIVRWDSDEFSLSSEQRYQCLLTKQIYWGKNLENVLGFDIKYGYENSFENLGFCDFQLLLCEELENVLGFHIKDI